MELKDSEEDTGEIEDGSGSRETLAPRRQRINRRRKENPRIGNDEASEGDPIERERNRNQPSIAGERSFTTSE